ncbi:MAG: DUF4139 domain-containing protein [Cytophagales bacterium]|nr:DUF4139 domain-containing protein [Cytophagales bacterium]
MKHSLLSFLFILFALQTWAEDRKIKIDSEIKGVVVYLNGAEINRVSKFQLPAGRSDIQISGLSTQIKPKSIQALLSGDARILSISNEKNFLNPHQNRKKVQVLKDSLTLLKDQIEMLTTEIDDIDDERDMIISNRSRVGEKGGVTVAELQSASAFFKKRLKEISKEKFELGKQVRELTKSKVRISKQLKTDNTLKDKPTNIVTIKVDNPKSQMIDLEFSYVVSEAGWAPRYNVRAEGVDQPIQFEYMAKVFNNTAIDWKGVELILSTGDPFKSLTVPKLQAWTLNYRSQYQYKKRRAQSQGYLSQQTLSSNNSNQTSAQLNDFGMGSNEVDVSEISVDFVIKDKYSIPSDNKPYLVEVNSYELNASYKYYAIPKLECDAFLMANVTNWENVNIIDSYANIYYNGKYVGESYISTATANDTLAFSLGRDSKINITRVKKQDFNKKKWIGLNRSEYFEYEIAIRNTYNTPIEIEVVDQVPVSQESDIEVDVKEISGADHHPKSGRLEWKLKIEPKTTQKLITSFSVKYPKNKKVHIRKKRRVNAKYF